MSLVIHRIFTTFGLKQRRFHGVNQLAPRSAHVFPASVYFHFELVTKEWFFFIKQFF